MKLEFIELELDWPSGLSVFHLKSYILSKLFKHGEPLRWAITSITTQSKKKPQIISIEAMLITYQDKGTSLNPELD